jgi:hypothetical protein
MFSLGKPILTTDCTNGLVEGFDRAAPEFVRHKRTDRRRRLYPFKSVSSVKSVVITRLVRGVLVRSSIGSNEKSHGETGFGLVYPSLRILRKPSRSSSCSALSWRLPTWPFDSIAEVA